MDYRRRAMKDHLINWAIALFLILLMLGGTVGQP